MNFEKAVNRTLRYEGGYSNDPDDPGGETKFGITKRDHPHLDIKNLTPAQAKQIYYTEFWLPLRLDEVKDIDVAAEIFDTAVNMGPASAVRFAQTILKALGKAITVDGVIGPQTLGFLNGLARGHRNLLLVLLNIEQGHHYISIALKREKSRKYLAGWVRHRIQLKPVLLSEEDGTSDSSERT